MNIHRIDVQDLAQCIFMNNTNDVNILIETNNIKCNQDLFFFLFDLLCKGLILVYSHENSNKVCLNHLTVEQFDFMKKKFKNAHIKLNIITYDIETALLLDLVDKDYKSRNLIRDSIDHIQSMGENESLSEYVFNVLMDDNLFSINFEVLKGI